MTSPPRSIVAIDVGATNVDVVQFSPELQVIARKGTGAERKAAPPYLHLDADKIIGFAIDAIRQFDRELPVDAIVPCTHGSAAGLLTQDGNLALPIMSYLADVPGEVATAYAAVEPAFGEVFAPTNPGALTLARQLLWQQMSFPEEFARVQSILPYAQYIAFRLSGVQASEITSLGAQTHLWAPLDRDFSGLAKSQGWAERVAARRPAGDPLGALRGAPLQGEGIVHCGIHDSSASFLQYAALEPVILLSTGTWIIAFDTGAGLTSLDAARDQVANLRIDGSPIASARFMGGEEFGMIAGAGNLAAPDPEVVRMLMAQGTMALPSFTDSGGPVPGTGGQGRIVGPLPQTDAARASLAALYTAMMTALALDRLGQTKRIVVDGVFARNACFMGLLAALMPDRAIHRVTGEGGSARGAASLALPGAVPGLELSGTEPADIPELPGYFSRWQAAAEEKRSSQ